MFPDALPGVPDASHDAQSAGTSGSAGASGIAGAGGSAGARGGSAGSAGMSAAGGSAGSSADASQGGVAGDASGSAGADAAAGGAPDASADAAADSVLYDASLDADDDATVRRVVAIAPGAVWKYLDDGVEQTGWSSPTFDDSAWKAGPAELGYGDADEATTVGFGPNAASKFPTTWFRHTFAVKDASRLAGANLGVVRDDGIVVHLNGSEVARSNLPAGPVTATTLALVTVSAPEESAWFPFSLPVSPFVTGANTVAVEIHQQRGDSSDISFNLELILMLR